MCTLFFFNDTATTEIYTLSLHDALPISASAARLMSVICSYGRILRCPPTSTFSRTDRKSTRLNSSHTVISYAVFCLQKKIHTGTASAPHLPSPLLRHSQRELNLDHIEHS